jgi:glycosyltransferase involved in cell wall biosynthesis
MKAVSVVVTLYNYRNYIGEAIESFLKQNFDDSEMVIVDDGSQDDPYEVIGKYESDRVRYIRLDKNQGQAHAKNVGIETAEAEILVMLDADDMLTENSISVRYNKLQEGYDFVHGPALNLYDKIYMENEINIFEKALNKFKREVLNVYVPVKRDPLERKRIVPDRKWALWMASDKGPSTYRLVHTQTIMLRKDIHRKIGLYDETLWCKVDSEMWGRIFNHGFRIGWVEDYICIYRKHPNQLHKSRAKVLINKKLQKDVLARIERRKTDLSDLRFLK